MDKQEFSSRIMEMEGTLHSVARTFFASPHDCADAVQEAVLKAWQGRHTLRNDAYFGTWVVRILMNQCKSMYRQRARQVPVAQVPEASEAPQPDLALRDAVMGLDLLYRLPFVLHYVEGYSTQEIAGILRVPKGTILSRLHRARKQLGHVLSEEARPS